MHNRHYQCGLALVLTLGLITTISAAESKHGNHGQHHHPGEKKSGHDDHKRGHDTQRGQHDAKQGGHTHQHAKWEPPPADYASLRSDRWTNTEAIACGKTLFKTNC